MGWYESVESITAINCLIQTSRVRLPLSNKQTHKFKNFCRSAIKSTLSFLLILFCCWVFIDFGHMHFERMFEAHKNYLLCVCVHN